MNDHDSQMDARGVDNTDAAGRPEDNGSGLRSTSPPQPQPVQDVIQSAINSAELNSAEYKIFPKAGKAVIVSNFMEGYEPRPNHPKDPECRGYASEDCSDLADVLDSLKFEPLSGDEPNGMVYKNLTKKQFTDLYKRAAKKEDYRPENGQGYTCVLFIVMSYGRSGLIKCHAEDPIKGHHEYVEQKDIQEAFQPQNNHSLALKPKIFIIQTIPEATDKADGDPDKEFKTTKRIPREADFLTYSCDSYCLSNKEGCGHENIFARSIFNILTDIADDKKKREPALEIQRMFIKMNKYYKDKRNDNWKIPCVTSSLTKKLKLF